MALLEQKGLNYFCFFIFSVSAHINQLKNIQKKQAYFPVESTPGYLKKNFKINLLLRFYLVQ